MYFFLEKLIKMYALFLPFHFPFIHKITLEMCTGVRQELLSEMKSVGEQTSKTRVNINIFLSQDVPDDGFSDNDGANNPENHVVSAINEILFLTF